MESPPGWADPRGVAVQRTCKRWLSEDEAVQPRQDLVVLFVFTLHLDGIIVFRIVLLNRHHLCSYSFVLSR